MRSLIWLVAVLVGSFLSFAFGYQSRGIEVANEIEYVVQQMQEDKQRELKELRRRHANTIKADLFIQNKSLYARLLHSLDLSRKIKDADSSESLQISNELFIENMIALSLLLESLDGNVKSDEVIPHLERLKQMNLQYDSLSESHENRIEMINAIDEWVRRNRK